MAYGANTTYVSYRLVAGQPPARPGGDPARHLPQLPRAGVRAGLDDRRRSARSAARRSMPTTGAPVLAPLDRAEFQPAAPGGGTSGTARRRSADWATTATSLPPACSSRDARSRRDGRARLLDRAASGPRRRRVPGAAERRARKRSCARRTPRTPTRSSSNWCLPPTSSSSPAAAGRSRRPIGDRRLSLVQRLGPRHDDLRCPG